MVSKLNQRMHEFLGKHKIIKYTNCLERGCKTYHGNSPSQLAQFIGRDVSDNWRKILTKPN